MLSGISGWSRTTVDTFLSSAGHMLNVFLVEVKDSHKRRLVDVYSVDSPVEPRIPAIYPASAVGASMAAMVGRLLVEQ